MRTHPGFKRDGRAAKNVVMMIAVTAVSAVLRAQTSTPAPVASSTTFGGSAYVHPTTLPALVNEFLTAIGNRLQKPGQERMVLTGTYTDSADSTPAVITWEAPGSVRVDRTGMPSLIYSAAAGVSNATALANADLEILESLLDDRPETFLYGFARGYGHRLLGARFRTDNGKTPNFAGPWYDIYDTYMPVAATAGKVQREKYFCFDSQTKLPTQTAYMLSRTSGLSKITTEYTNWTIQNGQAIPGQIARKEKGSVVFTFKTSAATIGPAVQDGIFTRP